MSTLLYTLMCTYSTHPHKCVQKMCTKRVHINVDLQYTLMCTFLYTFVWSFCTHLEMLHILWGILLAHWSLRRSRIPRTCGEGTNGLIIWPIKICNVTYGKCVTCSSSTCVHDLSIWGFAVLKNMYIVYVLFWKKPLWAHILFFKCRMGTSSKYWIATYRVAQ